MINNLKIDYLDNQIEADGIKPQLAPISSIMGQIMMLGMWSENNKTSPLEVRTLADWVVR